ncbi:MAG: flagellar brake protein [Sideroxydans sp.]|nr:flagellar brake protein [Sideroxydans sp.]
MNNNLQTGKLEISDDFLALQLQVGDALQLQADAPNQSRTHAKLLGYLAQQSLIVSLPSTQTQVQVGEGFVLRGFVGNTSYEFYSRVLSVNAEPYAHLHFTFPQQISLKKMHRAMRVKVNCAATVSVQGLKSPVDLIELSELGGGFRCATACASSGDAVTLNFSLPLGEHLQAFQLQAVVRHVELDVHGQKYGVEFVELGRGARSALQELVCVSLIQLSEPKRAHAAD